MSIDRATHYEAEIVRFTMLGLSIRDRLRYSKAAVAVGAAITALTLATGEHLGGTVGLAITLGGAFFWKQYASELDNNVSRLVDLHKALASVSRKIAT